MSVKLREHQEEGIAEIRQLIAAGQTRILRQAPTGAGKTTEFVYIAAGAAQLGNAIDIWVHREELIKQVSERLRLFNVPHGIVAPGQPRTNHLVQVCSIFTLARRLDRHRKPDIIIIDECHHAVAGTWLKCINAYPDAALLGFTATPERLDGTGLNSVFDVMVHGPQVTQLIEAGYLVQPITYAPQLKDFDDPEFKIERGDFVRRQTAQELDKPAITGDAVAHYQRICPGLPAIVFCVTVKHAKNVAAAFNEAGIKAAVLEGGMNEYERKSTLDSFNQKRIQVLVTVDLVSEGFDCPGIVCCIMLRPTASLGLLIQMMGRCLRADEISGKLLAYIIDHVGNCRRHSFFADSFKKWDMEGRKKRSRGGESAPTVMVCEQCFAAFRPAASCPVCGVEIKKTASREIDQVDGELVIADQEAVVRAKELARKAWGRARSMEALIMQCHFQNKNWKYAYHLFNARMKKDGKPTIPIPNILPEKFKQLIAEHESLAQQKLFEEKAS